MESNEVAFRRIVCVDHSDWLEKRKPHIQASEAAITLDCSPWGCKTDLYDVKTGAVKAKDISKAPYVIYGQRMEPVIRESVMLDLPFFELHYDQYGILESIERPWQGCTLDGELTVIADNPWNFKPGDKGVLEIKTGSFRRESDLDEWKNGIPQHYYCQVIHQLSVTGYRFAIVAGRLRRDAYRDEDLGFPEIRNFYRIVDTRNRQVQSDITALNEAEMEFHQRLLEKRRPARKLVM